MKATHDGHCQICGSLQRLPNGLLVKHGYSVEFGFFSGTCFGSGGLPFQVSTDLIQAAIEQQQRTVVELQNQIDALTDLSSGVNQQPFVWVREYLGHSLYVWRNVGLTEHEVTNAAGDYSWKSFRYNDWQGKVAKVETHGEAKTLADCVLMLNHCYAAHLQADVQRRLGYIAWQRKRVENWVAAPLLPRASK